MPALTRLLLYNARVAHQFTHFSKNGELLPTEEAVVPLSSIEYAYGFGVYETIRVANGTLYFLPDHVERLLASAQAIGLAHTFVSDSIAEWVRNLAADAGIPSCNVKLMLIGAPRPEDATLYMLPLAPLFPDDSLYKKGAHCTLYAYERPFPHAKTLNMLGSYLAYREAKEAGAYDALLTDSAGAIREGTRTNFFCLNGETIISPPREHILPGVTRKALLGVAATEGYDYREADIKPTNLSLYDSAFLTSTSAKVMPVRSIGTHEFGAPPPELTRLIHAFDSFLSSSHGIMPH